MLQHLELPFKAAAASNVGTRFSPKDAGTALDLIVTVRRRVAELTAQERNARAILNLEVGAQSNLLEMLLKASDEHRDLTVKQFVSDLMANAALSSKGKAA